MLTKGTSNQYAIIEEPDGLKLISRKDPNQKIYVDFIKGSNRYRRLNGGGRNQALAKAVGLKSGRYPSIVDATAGLGRDAFVLASLGCRVHMIERHALVYALLKDGLCRAKSDDCIGSWVQDRMTLQQGDSILTLGHLEFIPEVIYLDPMYPFKRRTALVKKETRVLQELVGYNIDEADLLKMALNIASQRVVVKRPISAQPLAGKISQNTIKLKKHRFDIYRTASVS